MGMFWYPNHFILSGKMWVENAGMDSLLTKYYLYIMLLKMIHCDNMLNIDVLYSGMTCRQMGVEIRKAFVREDMK